MLAICWMPPLSAVGPENSDNASDMDFLCSPQPFLPVPFPDTQQTREPSSRCSGLKFLYLCAEPGAIGHQQGNKAGLPAMDALPERLRGSRVAANVDGCWLVSMYHQPLTICRVTWASVINRSRLATIEGCPVKWQSISIASSWLWSVLQELGRNLLVEQRSFRNI